MNIFPLKSFLLFMVLLLTFGGCKKKDHEKPQPSTEPPTEVQPEPEETFSLISTAGTPGDLIRIRTDKGLQTDTITIAVGDVPVTLYKVNDTLAMFRLPVLPQGPVNIDLSEVGAAEPVAITVDHYTPITQSEAVKAKFIDSLDHFMTWADTLEDQSMIAELKGLKAAFDAGYAKLTDDEKLQVAYFLERLNTTDGIERRNPGIGRLAPAGEVSLGDLRSFRAEFEDKALHFIAKAGFAYGLTATGVSIFLFPSPTFVEKVCGTAFCMAGIKLIKPAKESFKELTRLVFKQVSFSGIKEWTMSSGRKMDDPLTLQYARDFDLVFRPDKKLNIQIPSVYHSLSKDDFGQSTFFTTLFDWVADVQQVYTTVKKGIDKVRSWGSFFSDQVPQLPAFDDPVPDDPQSETRMTPADDIIIENVSNPNITLATTTQADVLTVTASAKQLKAATAFTFDIVYRYEKLGIDNKITVEAIYVVSGLSVKASASGDTATAEVTGGVPPYTFNWSNGRKDSVLYTLKPGEYTVTVTDAMDSTATATVEIVSECETSNLGVMAKAFGKTVSAMATGGAKPYTYLWSTGATDSTVDGLPPGEYTVTATDSIGCTASATVVVSETCESSDLRVTASVSGHTATAEASGGSPAYNYTWSNGATGRKVSDLDPGDYTVTVSDAAGCSAAVEVQVADDETEASILTEAAAVKELFEVNGMDVSDPRWNSKVASELVSVLTANGCWVTDNRVVRISLQNKGVARIPSSIGSLAKLQDLYLPFNKLTTLPPEIGQLTDLQTLNIGNNQLTGLPAEISQLTALRSLFAGNNQLTGLPSAIGQLTDLTTLSIGNNQLTQLPKEIGQLIHLTRLDVSSNKLTSLPPEIGQLTALLYLKLEGNQLAAVPSSIGQLTHLTELTLNSNRLTSLPSEIGSLVQLKTLSLSNNQLASIPAAIGHLVHLEVLMLNTNRLTSLPASIGNLTMLTRLDLEKNQLTGLPAGMGNLIHLTDLRLQENQLTSLPESLGNLKEVKALLCYNNQLTGLPASIGEMSSLERLEGSKNQITGIPASIGQLAHLTYVDLVQNKITAIPSSIGDLDKLVYLKLSRNQITSLPSTIGQPTALEALELSYNLLSTLPASIGQLTNLVSLRLEYNTLRAIPSGVGSLKNLVTLNLKGNQLTCLPQSVWDLNPSSFDWSVNGYYENGDSYTLCGFGDTQCNDRSCAAD